MKKLIFAVPLTICAVSIFAQGTITFGNHIVGSVVAPIYGPDPTNPMAILHGNDANGVPPGTTVYLGPRLSGTGYTVQLWAGPDVNSLAPTGPGKPFASGAGAGFFAPTTEIVGGVPPGGTAQLQVRAWNNQGGTITTWAQAMVGGGFPLGMSTIFTSQPLGGGISPPPNLLGLTSFNVAPGPEPSTIALAALGAAILLLFGRRK